MPIYNFRYSYFFDAIDIESVFAKIVGHEIKKLRIYNY